MMKILTNDTVQVLLGKDRGKSAKVLRVLPKKERILVEGVNLYKRHVRKMGQNQGGIIDVSKTVDISDVALICPNCKKATRVGFRLEQGRKVRICKKCQEVIATQGGKK